MASTKQTFHVAVIMGSDSDLPPMMACLDTLQKFKIPHTVIVASAHRTPEHLKRKLAAFEQSGGRVLIAAAGGAAHLPGVIASLSLLPVIGVPIPSPLIGLDSLLSIVQMPPGIPVATVGIGAAKNAALLAAHILALSDPSLRNRLATFRKTQADAVISKSLKIEKDLARPL